MEYKVFRYVWEKIQEYPKDFTLAYYDPGIKAFGYYACQLITNSDDSFELNGPDEEIKKWIAEQLEAYGNMLMITKDYHEEFEGGYMDYTVPQLVYFSDPMFPEALDNCVSTFSIGEDYFYTSEPVSKDGFKKVNSIADIKRLDREYSIKEAEENMDMLIEEKSPKTN